MKMGVAHFPPLTFRMASLWLGLPILAAVIGVRKLPFTIARAHWGRVALLALTNMVLWHVLMILAIPQLSSGRAAILGYTMPIFSAVLGALVFGDRLAGRAWMGVGAALVGVVLLLWHEIGALGGRPLGVTLMLVSAASWAMGTQLLRRLTVPVPLLTLSFWMVAITCVVLTVLAVAFERERWVAPDAQAWAAILYNGLLALGFAQTAWFFLVRTLPPVASTLSVMMIPVLGVFEFDQFAGGTKAIAQAIAESSAFSIAGGGDTLAAIAKYGIEKDVGYISTGGGAFLEVLEGKTLPAIEILQKRAAG